MPKGNSREPLNRWFVLLLAVCSSMCVGIWVGWVLGRQSSGTTGSEIGRSGPAATSKTIKNSKSRKAFPQSSSLKTITRTRTGSQVQQTSSETKQPACDLSSNLQHLQDNAKFDYPRQLIAGPMQADEMLMLFAMVRTSFVRRILEIGGYKGDSAYNWLEALRCKRDATVYTVDRNKVPHHNHPVVTHKTIQKDAANLVLEDIDSEPIDLLLLDCHAYEASQHIFKAVVQNNLLSRNGFIVLHDTGLHPTNFTWPHWPGPMVRTQKGVIHQPVERLLADWIPLQDCSFQRLSFHDDERYAPRHGLTILQRRTELDFDKECHLYGKGSLAGGLFDFQQKDCQELKEFSNKVTKECPA